MTTVEQSDLLISERVAGGILPKVLTTFDMVAIFVAIVLFITNSAVMQSAGPASFGWWVIGCVVFLLPCAVATGQLGVTFPGEGSIYLWTHKAFGPFWGFFAGFCAWWPGVLVMVATGTIVEAFIGFAFPSTATSCSCCTAHDPGHVRGRRGVPSSRPPRRGGPVELLGLQAKRYRRTQPG